MKNIRNNMKKRAGFTLVELLIVIIIIGILAGAMLLVAGSGTDKAEATKIVSNMRSLKAAALMKYADTANWTWADGTDIDDMLGSYMDRKIDTTGGYTYKLDTDTTSGDVVYISAAGFESTSGIADKLKDVGETSGLYSDAACQTELTAPADPVYMKIK